MLTCVQSDVEMCVWSPVTVTMTMATRIDHVADESHPSVSHQDLCVRENFGLTRPARYLLRLTPSSFTDAHLWDVRNAFDHVMLQKFELKQQLHKIRQRPHRTIHTEYSAKVVGSWFPGDRNNATVATLVKDELNNPLVIWRCGYQWVEPLLPS